MATLDLEDWIERTEPVALGLLRLMPWQWDTMLQRASVRDIEAVIAARLDERRRDLSVLAWQTAELTNATGKFKPVTVRALLESLAPAMRDPRAPIDTARYSEEAYEEDLVDAARDQAAAYERMGWAKTGRLTPEELAQARREAKAG